MGFVDEMECLARFMEVDKVKPHGRAKLSNMKLLLVQFNKITESYIYHTPPSLSLLSAQ